MGKKELSQKSIDDDNELQLEDILSDNQKKYVLEEFLKTDENN